MNIVRVELLNRKATQSQVYQKGEIYQAKIRSDGYATLISYGRIVLAPHEYRIYIADQEYDKLLVK